MPDITHTAVLGAGVIGASWAALFLAAGRSVTVFDPAPAAEARTRAYVDTAWPTLTELGLTGRGTPGALRFAGSAEEAVAEAGFIQENLPERLPLKHDLFARIEAALPPAAILSSSTSGLTLEALQQGWRNPAPLILGHPFNPPHLIPLVELTANAATGPGILERAEAFYADIGKVTIRIRKGMPGHIANRLQAAVWREAVHMAVEGVASVGDIDKAMWAGPGLRWAAMGPTMLFNLGAGDGGLQAFCDHFRDTFNSWWDDLGQIHLTDEVIETLVAGIRQEAGGQSPSELAARRDAMIVALQRALGDMRRSA
ncbi:3-hydroxyacyl-CoA dehydrogenase NAD-binding domain-containing protein [Ovoidimarina sediminis]|uniref:3-hydroxyacyl-CoA dehydrogenase NAD-binding domain-containing protein n=1 Tax=Ovoidimarina sediminis TaxID=3079856 RepID=UPI0029075988|nr:3-hydroxyacyl-CoA dehydrogenase NAD-binding domain-containing protein [Rhodophyticola sp. MJ-SS7]MDU8943596.1 3-hydroxyacyl-CoA dehydrogenase NAD-binding domain-containing protein [Rhodophyticola sp. MJ-SS7]